MPLIPMKIRIIRLVGKQRVFPLKFYSNISHWSRVIAEEIVQHTNVIHAKKPKIVDHQAISNVKLAIIQI